MIPFNLKQLETFLTVATLGSFRKAAERLNTTQPAISTRIAGLESALGTKLFERGGNIVQPTAEGQKLLGHAERVLRVAEKLHATASDLAEEPGSLRIGVAETVVHTWLRPFLARLETEFPQIKNDLVVDSSANLRSELMEHRIDLAILIGPVLEFNIGNLELNTTPLVWAGSPCLGLATDKRLSLCALVQHPIITYPRTTRPYAEIYHKLNCEGENAPRLLLSNGLAAAMRMAADGIGIASLPRELIERYARDGELVILDFGWTPSPLQFTASYSLAAPGPAVERAARIAAEVAQRHQADRALQAAAGR